MANKIRKLGIGKEVKERFFYIVDSPRPIFSTTEEGKKVDYFISEIFEAEDRYKIYVRKGIKPTDEVQHWKDEMKTDIVHPEYQLD
jgi:hypothetical protein